MLQKKSFLQLLAVAFLMVMFSVISAYAGEEATEEDAISLVRKAKTLLEEKGDEGLAVINKEDTGFYFKEKALYAFVYDENVVIIAHPYKPDLIGRSYKGKPDVRGVVFRDLIVDVAVNKGGGWTEYSYQKPGETGIHKKKAYSEMAVHNGKKYIVAAGIYSK